MGLPAKCLLNKHKEPSLILSAYMMPGHTLRIPALGRLKQEDPYGLLDSQFQ